MSGIENDSFHTNSRDLHHSHFTSNLHRFAAPIKPRCFKLPWPSVPRLLPYSPCWITDACLPTTRVPGEKKRTILSICHSLRPCQGRNLRLTNVVIKDLQLTPHNIISYQLSMSHKFAMALFFGSRSNIHIGFTNCAPPFIFQMGLDRQTDGRLSPPRRIE